METQSLGGTHFGFSATRIEDLGASEYTLVGITVDVSGSVALFRSEIEKCVKEVVRSCADSPRADNLMLRLTTFDDDVEEKHGFRLLSECDVSKYDGSVVIGGMTALCDASYDMIGSVAAYGKQLTENHYDVNGIVFVITDGADNRSKMTPDAVKRAQLEAQKTESLESILTILIGVNVTDPALAGYLRDFEKEAGFSKYVELADASAKSLAKLAEFVSKSISAKSQTVGTKKASAPLNF